jgi:aromatic-amino-acid transaminase
MEKLGKQKQTFLKSSGIDTLLEDAVFQVVLEAKTAQSIHGIDKVVNGTLGALYDEDNNLVTFPSVYQTFQSMSDKDKARYADRIDGSISFQDAIRQWLFKDSLFESDVLASIGGSGAISMAISNSLDRGETVLIPEIGWAPFHTISKQAQVNVETYQLFHEDRFNFSNLQEKMMEMIQKQGKVVLIINDPCHNPTGYTMSDEEWSTLLELLTSFKTLGPVVLILDVAYIDFSQLRNHYHHRFRSLATLPSHVLSAITFSASKTLTAYGMRLGALVLVSSNQAERKRFQHACLHMIRGTWSIANTGAMELMTRTSNQSLLQIAYETDRSENQIMLNKRAQLFLKEAREVSLPLYPYKEGFFVMIRLPNYQIAKEIDRLLKDQLIFGVLMTGGIRLALCSIPLRHIQGLAKKIKETINKVK